MTEDDLAASTPHGTGGTLGMPETSGAPVASEAGGAPVAPETEIVSGTGDDSGTRGIYETGDARVDAAVARLGELADAPLDEHPVILGQIHDRLREVLGELGSGTPAQETPATPGSPAAPYGPGSPGPP